MASVQLVRHATLLVRTGGVTVLVDPMLDEPGARDPIPNTPNEKRNPLVPLPDVDLAADAVVVTHTHADHLDDAAAEALDPSLPVFCQPEDVDPIAAKGFEDVRPVGSATTFEGLGLARTGGRHGHGPVADELGPVSGFVLSADGEPTVHVAGDTVWCDELADALERHAPDAVVLNTGGARFVGSEPITMTAEDVRHVQAAVPDAVLICVHLEAVNHCLLSRADLRAAVPDVAVPEDGETVELG